MEKTTPPANRSAPLDALRAVAVLLVLGRHFPEARPGETLPGWMELWLRGGWIGVDLFFVLSGFLVSGLLFREYRRFGEIRYGHFLARRACKIYPAFYFMFGAVLLFAAQMGRPFVGWPVVLSEIFFVQNYGPALFPHSWSLAVEEHFYLLLPLLLLAVRGKSDVPFARLPWLFVAVAVLALAARIVTTQTLGFRLKTHLFPTHLRLDALLFGVLLSWATQFHPAALERVWARFRWPGAWRPLACIGAYSYSIYLWHIPVRFFGLAWLPREASPLARGAAYLALSIGIGIFAAWLIERPFLAWRDRLFPTRSQAAPSSCPSISPGDRDVRHRAP